MCLSRFPRVKPQMAATQSKFAHRGATEPTMFDPKRMALKVTRGLRNSNRFLPSCTVARPTSEGASFSKARDSRVHRCAMLFAAPQVTSFPGLFPHAAVGVGDSLPRRIFEDRFPLPCLIPHWRRYRPSSACSLNPQQRPSQSRRSWGCGTEKYRAYCGKTTGTENCTFPAQSGMAAFRIPRLAKAAPLFQSFGKLADRLEMHGLRAGNPLAGRSSQTP